MVVMTVTALDWPTFQGFFVGAVNALETGDHLGARRKCIQAKMVAIGLAGQVAAGGASVNLVIQECDNLMEQITMYQVEVYKTTGRRMIKTGLRNDGRKWQSEGDGGVLHD